MNIEKMKKLKQYLLSEPRRYSQVHWIARGAAMNRRHDDTPPCGKVCCLAGAACLMEGYQPEWNDGDLWGRDFCGYVVSPEESRELIADAATSILGLTDKEAANLFDSDCYGWSCENRLAYRRANTPRQRVLAAVAEIDRLIAIAESGN